MTAFRHDVAVVGAGPAGMAAATAAAELGLDTVLFDEQPAPGGQIYRNVEANRDAGSGLAGLLGDDYVRGRRLAEAFRAGSAAYAPGTSVWEIEPDGTVGTLRDGRAALVRARRIVVSAGAMERPVPIPGWTLPGVMTAGAAQTLLKAADAIPDGPVVLAGSGPLHYLVAWQLVSAGAEIRAILDTTPRANTRAALAQLPGALGQLAQIRKGRRWIAGIRAAGVRFVRHVSALAAVGTDRLDAVDYEADGRKERIETPLLLLHQGVVPNNQLADSIDCARRWDNVQACWHTQADAWGATSVDTVAVAGDCAGIGGALAAEHRGRLAGIDAAARLGKIDAGTRDRLSREPLAALRRLAGLRRFLDTLYAPAAPFLSPRDEVVVCRCEGVTAGELRDVAAHGCMGPNQAKAFTRAGMGPCQGRMCGLAVANVIAGARGRPVAEIGAFRVRPPVKPLTVGQLADLEGVSRDIASLDAMPTRPGDEAGETA
ncbi:MAG: NAD(P)-binding protein [Rhodospirillaceae bacterium]|nr:NAD(P)-binding protein [Rhodospirillaceae bacterium]